MKNLGSNIKTILKLVKENLNGLAIPVPSSGSGRQPSAPYSRNSSPYVYVGEETARVFIYGISEYGGDDLVMSDSNQRRVKRYFLNVRGEEQV